MTNFENNNKAEAAETVAEQIQSATNLLQLERALFAAGQLTNEAGQTYDAEEISKAIETLFYDGGTTAETITRSFGLRDKVVDLYGQQQAERINSIESAESLIDALYFVVGQHESLLASDGTPLDREELKANLRLLADGNTMDTLVTRKYGLRDLAVRLREQG